MSIEKPEKKADFANILSGSESESNTLYAQPCERKAALTPGFSFYVVHYITKGAKPVPLFPEFFPDSSTEYQCNHKYGGQHSLLTDQYFHTEDTSR